MSQILSWQPPAPRQKMGWKCTRQPPVYQRNILNIAYWRALAGFSAGLRRADRLVDGIDADNLIAGWGYDSDEIVKPAQDANMQAVIQKNRIVQRELECFPSTEAVARHYHAAAKNYGILSGGST